MLIIRLQRVGRTNDPSFRVIVTDSKKSAKTGKFLEIVGNYDARHGQPQFKAERIQKWIKDGAQLSETVHNLLVKNKIIDGQTIDCIPVKRVKAVAEILAETPKVAGKVAETVTPVAKVAETVTPVEAEEMLEAEEAIVEAPVETPAEEITVV